MIYRGAGAFFVTICVQDRVMLFGKMVDGQNKLNEFGKMVAYTWNDLSNHHPHIHLDEFVIMPNHIHGIIFIDDFKWNHVGAGSVRTVSEPAPTRTQPKQHGLPEIIRQFKTFSARRINNARQTPGIHVWQRNYYEHIVRDENELHRIRKYIIENPLHWDSDDENPHNTSTD
jgi:putative transposase